MILLEIVLIVLNDLFFSWQWRPSWRPSWISQIAQGYPLDIHWIFVLDILRMYNPAEKKLLQSIIVEENYSESVTIVRRQRFEGGFHIRKKYSNK